MGVVVEVDQLFVKKWGWGKLKSDNFVDLWVDLIDKKNNNLKNIKVEDKKNGTSKYGINSTFKM